MSASTLRIVLVIVIVIVIESPDEGIEYEYEYDYDYEKCHWPAAGRVARHNRRVACATRAS